MVDVVSRLVCAGQHSLLARPGEEGLVKVSQQQSRNIFKHLCTVDVGRMEHVACGWLYFKKLRLRMIPNSIYYKWALCPEICFCHCTALLGNKGIG